MCKRILFLLGIVLCFNSPLLQAQYSDCQSLIYYDVNASRHEYSVALPSPTFAFRMTPSRVGRLDSAFIGFGIQKTAATAVTSDTVIVRILEDQFPAMIEIHSYVFSFPPDIFGNIPDAYWILELDFITRTGTVVNPARDFWFTWRFSGPSSDIVHVHLKEAQAPDNRSYVLNSVGQTTPISTYVAGQISHEVSLMVEGRMCYVPIPIELSSFHCSYIDGKAYLEWITASETDNFGFEIERRGPVSDDGAVTLWQKLAFVNGNGTTMQEQRYAYIDENPSVAMDAEGIVRYRLRQIDYDGASDLSPIQSIVIPADRDAVSLKSTYPNPVSAASGLVTIPFTVDTDVNARIEIRDAIGRLVAVAFSGDVRAGYHSVTYPVSSLVPGLYTSTLMAGDKTSTTRFLVTK